jgi:hypothetical protein
MTIEEDFSRIADDIARIREILELMWRQQAQVGIDRVEKLENLTSFALEHGFGGALATRLKTILGDNRLDDLLTGHGLAIVRTADGLGVNVAALKVLVRADILDPRNQGLGESRPGHIRTLGPKALDLLRQWTESL